MQDLVSHLSGTFSELAPPALIISHFGAVTHFASHLVISMRLCHFHVEAHSVCEALIIFVQIVLRNKDKAAEVSSELRPL